MIEKEYNVVVQMLITANSPEDALRYFVEDLNTAYLQGTLDAEIVEEGHEEKPSQ